MKCNGPLTKKGLQLCPDIYMCSYYGCKHGSHHLSKEGKKTHTTNNTPAAQLRL